MGILHRDIIKIVAGVATLAVVVLGFHSLNTRPISSGPSVPHKITLEVRSVDKPVMVADPNVIRKTMSIETKHGSLSNKTFIEGDTAYIGMFSAITMYDVSALWEDIIVIYQTTDVRKLEIAVNSPGGGAFDGLAIADNLERAKRMGFKITAIASGIVASAAVPIYAVASERVAAPSTIFMVHESALWKWPGRETHSDIISQTRLLKLLQTRYLTLLANHSYKSFDAWKALEKETTWFSAKQAMNWGLVDSIEGE